MTSVNLNRQVISLPPFSLAFKKYICDILIYDMPTYMYRPTPITLHIRWKASNLTIANRVYYVFTMYKYLFIRRKRMNSSVIIVQRGITYIFNVTFI